VNLRSIFPKSLAHSDAACQVVFRPDVQTYNPVTVYLACLDASWEPSQGAGIAAGENTPTAPKP
jgi:hypothetical protein